jgi:sugar lactone lactonase YvrE
MRLPNRDSHEKIIYHSCSQRFTAQYWLASSNFITLNPPMHRALPQFLCSRPFLRLMIVIGGILGIQRLQGQVLYVTEVSPSEKVVAYNLSNLQPVDTGTPLTNGLFVPSGHLEGLATDPSGNVFVAYENVIKEFDDTGAVVTSFGTNGTLNTGINSIVTGAAVNPAGTQLLVPYSLNTSAVLAYNTSNGSAVGGFTGATVVAGNPTLSAATPWAVAFNPSGTHFYVTSPSGAQGGTTITQFSLTGGTGTLITPVNYPFYPGGSGSYGGAEGLVFQTDSTFVVEDVNLGLLARYTLSGATAALDTTFGVNGFITGLNGMNGGITADSSGNLYVFLAGGSSSTIEELSANGQVLNSALLTLPAGNTYGGHLAIGIAAIPEPETSALLAIGTVALGVARFRRRRS